MPTPRTQFARIRTALGVGAVCCALALTGAGVAGAVFSDRTLVTQYLSWIPGVALWPAACFAAVVGISLARRPRFGWKGRMPRGTVIACVACAVMGAVGIGATWRAGAAFHSASERSAPAVRVLHWNMTSHGSAIWERPFVEVPGVGRPDIVLLTTTQGLKRLRKSCAGLGEPFRLQRQGMFSVASRFPISAWIQRPLFNERQRTELGLDRTPPGWLVRLYNAFARDSGIAARDFDDPDWGTINIIKFDTGAVLGRPLVVWFVDIPSNPLVSRRRLLDAARVRIEADRAESCANADASDPLCGRPDLIVGDFNTPRGAASIRAFAPGYRNAADGAGPGVLASWPRRLPLWHLDQALVAPGLRAIDYALIDAGESDHRAQAFTVAALGAESVVRTSEDRAELHSISEDQP